MSAQRRGNRCCIRSSLASWQSLWAVLAGTALLIATTAADEIPVVDERRVKSAFLYNFAKFTEWPPESLPAPGEPIVFGVLGEAASAAEMVAELQAVVKGRHVNSRAVSVLAVRTAEEARATQVLFVVAPLQPQVAQVLAEIRDSSVLTVGESASFASQGGAIGFVQEADKLRFEINVATAERARLKISAHLQKLARRIVKEP